MLLTSAKPITSLRGNKEKFWSVLAERIARPEWAADHRHATFKARLLNRDALTRDLDAALMARSTAEWMGALGGLVPASPVYDVGQAPDNPFVRKDGRVATFTRAGGRPREGWPPVRINGQPAPTMAAPALGADTAAVLGRLGLVDLRFAKVAEKPQRHARAIFSLIEERFGVGITEGHQEIQACVPDEHQARGLRPTAGSAALLIARRHLATGRKLVEMSRSLHPADRFRYSMTLRVTILARVRSGLVVVRLRNIVGIRSGWPLWSDDVFQADPLVGQVAGVVASFTGDGGCVQDHVHNGVAERQKAHVLGAIMDTCQEGAWVRLFGTKGGAGCGGLQGKAHHDVGGGDLRPGEPAGGGEGVVPVAFQPFQVRVHEALLQAAEDQLLWRRADCVSNAPMANPIASPP